MTTEPRSGDVRFTPAGDLEVFDGTSWGPYRRLPGDGEGEVVFRDE